MSEPQWLTLGRIAAARALYETWHPTRTDNGFPAGALSWEQLSDEERERFLVAGNAACAAFHDSSLDSSREAIERFRRAGGGAA